MIQRGNNRTAMFADPQDRCVFTEQLCVAMRRHACLIHAYVFMSNHIHLLMTPRTARGIGLLMQSLGRRYVPYFNSRHGRTGTLFEGRYRATLIESEPYLLTCYRYIELNPVRAGLVRHPAEYRWSSHTANAFGAVDQLVSPHERYLALARDTAGRHSAYRGLFNSAIDDATLTQIRRATNFEWVLGSEDFGIKVGTTLNRRAAPLRRGPRIRL